MRSQTLECFYLLFLLALFFSFHSATSKSHLQLKRGASLSVDDASDFLTSPDNSFTCGFHNLGSSNAYWFAVWFTNSKDKTAVWMANRDRPVNSHGSEVHIRGDGTMILTDVDGTVVWQTNTTTTDVAIAKVLNSGNLVLENPQGDILWQSFDFPTDTLLPFQTFTKNKRLTSALRKGSYESGYFNLNFGSDNVLRLISDTPDTSSNYWPNPDFDVYTNGRTNYNSSRVAFLDDMGRFLSSDRLQINASDMGYGIKRRMTIDFDGNLRIYSLMNSTGLWEITWQALLQPCSVLGAVRKKCNMCLCTGSSVCMSSWIRGE
ncbi:G-type lectin S-receptor-like serine/threonine-protein kinase [Forsythia ovata]|uniref:G-type lectin S-receptor-like serine/threonine-protein kinase n=1 Tax=Forsythia ovata TaxID=205694 RepID=A0ABD1WY68_9LAMI